MRVWLRRKDIEQAKNDIKHGRRSEYCPIAQLLKRRGHKDVSVGNMTYRVGSWFTRCRLSKSALTVIENFDNDNDVKPQYVYFRERV